MREGKSRRTRGQLRRGALLSILLHAHLLVPLLVAAWIYGAREEAQRPEEVDVAFEDVKPEELPPDLPPVEPLKPEASKPPPRPKEKTKKEPLAKKKKEKQAETKPEPEVVTPPLPPMPPPEPTPPPPPPERRDHEKMVDLDNDKQVEPPPDAKYLAQKNNRAAEETRATDTNPEKESKGEQAASAPSEHQDPDVGGDKAKIAELEDQKSKIGRKAPDVTPHADPELSQAPEPPRNKSLLALRDPAPRTHELTPETADPSLPRAPDGDVAAPRPPVRGETSDPAQAQGKRVKLRLSGKDYEYLFGADAEAERRLAQKQRSVKQGKFQQRLARTRAALENFIPEVKPGNQTALNTRAAPFAAYIARMHRSIHQLWGFGQLEDWDEKSGSSPFNNPNLLTTLEMVLNGDGTIDKVTIVRSSGLLDYDVAAIDVAYSAGPYPDPPREIRSANGKIYIHWRFYRDGRQCATSGVDYFILNNPPAGGDKPAVAELPTSPRPEVPRAPSLSPSSGTTGEGGPRRLQRSETPAHREKMRQLDREVAAAEGSGSAAAEEREPAHAAPPAAAPRADNPVARAIADRWFAALAKGDTAAMADTAAYPFKTGAGVVKTRAQLLSMLADLTSEASQHRPRSPQIFTSAGARSAIGRLPPGLDEGGGTLFAVSAVDDHDALILVLAQRTGGWKTVGLVRR